MSGPEGLATGEGVDEGSARSTGEAEPGPVPGRPDVEHEVSAVSPGPQSAGVPGEQVGEGTGDGDLLGEPPHGAPVDGEQAAAPDDMESEESRRTRAEQAPGQQYSEGEG